MSVPLGRPSGVPLELWALLDPPGEPFGIYTGKDEAERDAALAWNQTLRAVELVEVVRCKHCARFDRGAYSTRELGFCSLMNDMVHEDSFCSFVVSKL